MPSSAPGNRPTRRRTALPRRLHAQRTVFFVLVLILLALVLRARCLQVNAQRDDRVAAGVAALARAIREGADLSPAREIFEAAAEMGAGDPFPSFCVSAVDELSYVWWPPDAPDGWSAAVDALRIGQLPTAEATFRDVAEGRSPYAERARYYVRLIEEISAVPP